jgi:alpha-L-fucosidase
VEGIPTGPIALKGIKNEIARIRIVGEGTLLSHEIYNKLYWSEDRELFILMYPKKNWIKR